MKINTGQLESNGVLVRFELTIPDQVIPGAPITFLQGSSANSNVWNAQIVDFPRRHRVLRCDLWPKGSDSLTSPVPRDETRALLAVLDHLDISETFLVGCCRGSDLVLDLALRFPGRVRAAAAVLGPCAGDEPVNTISVMSGDLAPHRRLNEILASVMLITGGLDEQYVQEEADALAAGIARSRRCIIPNCGRMPNLNAPRPFNEALRAFVQDNEIYTDMM